MEEQISVSFSGGTDARSRPFMKGVRFVPGSLYGFTSKHTVNYYNLSRSLSVTVFIFSNSGIKQLTLKVTAKPTNASIISLQYELKSRKAVTAWSCPYK